MSRVHISLPAKSKLFRMPVPVITHTFRPSVTGDGDDMFCFCSRRLPALRNCFQFAVPLVRSTLHRNRSLPCATLRKTCSPHTIAVDPDHAGSGSRHATFSLLLQRTGRLVSPLRPLAVGPRQFGQFSAYAGVAAVTISAAKAMRAYLKERSLESV